MRSSEIEANASSTVGSNWPVAALDHLARRAIADRGAVGAVAGERVERVGEREHAGRERDLLAGQAVRVAAAVPALVVVADQRPRGLEERDLADDLLADQRVALHHLALARGRACRP